MNICLEQKIVTYNRKKFYNIGPRDKCYKDFFRVIYGFSYLARVFARLSIGDGQLINVN